MAKKAKPKQPTNTEIHFCGDCGNGEWYKSNSNQDINGLPLCVACKFHKWARVRSRRACEKWKPKQQGEMLITPYTQKNVTEANLAKLKPHKFKD